MDGPVVQAAQRALEERNVDLILPYVPAEGEEELRAAFEKVVSAREQGQTAKEVADRYFYETAVRVHRAGEGAPFTGLKPAGLDVGPVIPIAEKAIEAGSADELAGYLCDTVREEVERRFHHMLHLKEDAHRGVQQARAYVEAMLGLQVWSHSLYECVHADPHEGHHDHG
jgi:hypothetical protein